MEKDGIRIFLETPETLELAAPGSKNEKIKCFKRKQTSKRKEKLPPYIPYKSIFEEKYLSKLTERQKILALKYQTNVENASSLFIAVNDIRVEEKNNISNTKISDETVNNRKGSKKNINDDKSKTEIHENPTESLREPCNKKLIEDRPMKHGQGVSKNMANEKYLHIKLRPKTLLHWMPFKTTINCEQCKEGVIDLLNYFGWIQKQHECKLTYKAKMQKIKLLSKMMKSKCICKIEEKFFIEAFSFNQANCCKTNVQNKVKM